MKLKDKFVSVVIWSENHKKLAKWYEEVMGFTVREVLDYPNDQCIDFDFGSCYFSIGWHDKVKGMSKDPYRTMVGFDVESVMETYTELKEKKVKIIAEPFLAPPGGFWCMTVEDPDGNIVQFFGDK